MRASTKEEIENSNKGNKLNLLNIPDINIELIITIVGILLLFITFLISVSLSTPENLNKLVDYFETQRALLILNYLGLLVTFSGITFMIFSFYQSWKDAINKIYEKMK